MMQLELDERRALRDAVRRAVFDDMPDGVLVALAATMGLTKPRVARSVELDAEEGRVTVKLDGAPVPFAFESGSVVVLQSTDEVQPHGVRLHFPVMGSVVFSDEVARAVGSGV